MDSNAREVFTSSCESISDILVSVAVTVAVTAMHCERLTVKFKTVIHLNEHGDAETKYTFLRVFSY
jgi:hypothetical protein